MLFTALLLLCTHSAFDPKNLESDHSMLFWSSQFLCLCFSGHMLGLSQLTLCVQYNHHTDTSRNVEILIVVLRFRPQGLHIPSLCLCRIPPSHGLLKQTHHALSRIDHRSKLIALASFRRHAGVLRPNSLTVNCSSVGTISGNGDPLGRSRHLKVQHHVTALQRFGNTVVSPVQGGPYQRLQ